MPMAPTSFDGDTVPCPNRCRQGAEIRKRRRNAQKRDDVLTCEDSFRSVFPNVPRGYRHGRNLDGVVAACACVHHPLLLRRAALLWLLLLLFFAALLLMRLRYGESAFISPWVPGQLQGERKRATPLRASARHPSFASAPHRPGRCGAAGI